MLVPGSWENSAHRRDGTPISWTFFGDEIVEGLEIASGCARLAKPGELVRLYAHKDDDVLLLAVVGGLVAAEV
jgi:hypothetical protein